MARPLQRRLPGVRFEAQAPVLRDALPRMDVAAFVGFAAMGPLHVPVPVEDPLQFEALFGREPVLAWDPVRSAPVTALLAPSVRAFFRNGGKRCWVVRVADETRARTNLFPVPALLRVSEGSLRPAVLSARSPGSWSDGVSVSTTLSSEPLEAISAAGSAAGLTVTVSAPSGLSRGDLLRLAFADGRIALMAVLRLCSENGQPLVAAPPRGILQAQSSGPVWLEQGAALPSGPLLARWSAGDGTRTAAASPVPGFAGRLLLPVPPAAAPAAGMLVSLEGADPPAWFKVAAASASPGGGTGLDGSTVRVVQPAGALPRLVGCERLTFSLWARNGADPLRLDGLGFCPAHPRFAGALPDDASLFASPAQPPADESDALLAGLWRDASDPRFPLAASGEPADFYVPVGMPVLAADYLGCAAPSGVPLERDGLARFSSSLFLDEHLSRTGVRTLLAEAAFRYQRPDPLPLRGVHAVLPVEEATLIAAPDAAQRGWLPAREDPPVPPAPPEPAPPVGWDRFLDCGLRPLGAPSSLSSSPAQPGERQPFALLWTQASGDPSWYEVQEASLPDWSDAEEVARTSATSAVVYGRDAAALYFRVRAAAEAGKGPWSEALVVRVGGDRRFVVPEAGNPAELLAVQRALLRLACARGDLLALLSLPAEAREDDAIAHAGALRARADEGAPVPGQVQPLFSSEDAALGFGALYHPWIFSSEEGRPDQLSLQPPDGAAAGMIARRSLERGAWIAPSNDPLRGVLALSPGLDRSRLADLSDSQVNAVVQEARGFLPLSESTLSPDPDLCRIHVRRLLALLRRAALHLGTRYVFETDDLSFRRLLQRGFEALLRSLFSRGAFGGRGRDSSFQVAVGGDRVAEEGRVTVELRVAPAESLRLLTVRLVQAGNGALTTEEP